jgi:hypothetical protein
MSHLLVRRERAVGIAAGYWLDGRGLEGPIHVRVRLGELDSGADLGLISPQTHELTPNFTTHTRTSLAHWNPSRVRLVRVWAP